MKTRAIYETLLERYGKGLKDGIEKIIDSCRNLGDRYKYPHGTFSMGITKFAKMKGIEKFGCPFYLVLFLNTYLANKYYFEGDKKIQENDNKNFAQTRNAAMKYIIVSISIQN